MVFSCNYKTLVEPMNHVTSFAKEAEIIIKSATLTLAHHAFPPKLIHSALTQGMKGKQFEFLFLFLTLPSATTSCKICGDTSPSWGVVNLPIIFYNAAPLPPLSMLLAIQNIAENLNSQYGRGKREGGGGKDWNCRMIQRVLEARKAVFSRSVSPILQTF